MSAALDSVSHLRVDLRSGRQEEKAPFFYLSNQNLPCHVEKPLLCALCPPGEVSLYVAGQQTIRESQTGTELKRRAGLCFLDRWGEINQRSPTTVSKGPWRRA